MVDQNGVLNRSNPFPTTTRNNTSHLYNVTLKAHTIHTLVTHHPSQVDRWLSNNAGRRQGLMVGLDVEWRPNTQNRIATLQLCVGHACLVFQIIHSPFFSHSFSSFLQDPKVIFFGVGIRTVAEKLYRDYGISLANVCDLGSFPERTIRRYPPLKEAVKKRLCGVNFEKPLSISRSSWENIPLTAEQVQYACIDAFLCFDIGRRSLC